MFMIIYIHAQKCPIFVHEHIVSSVSMQIGVIFMSYQLLSSIFYSSQKNYEDIYRSRISSEYTHHINFYIGDFPAFYTITPKIHQTILDIQKLDKKVLLLRRKLPPIAIQQFTTRCLIDEVALSNNIEGVHSTRKEILSALEKEDKRARFHGIVQKYLALDDPKNISVATCQDIRNIYDEIVLDEVVNNDPSNMPDGKIFRKNSVSVASATQKEIHRGLMPEEKIISSMEHALVYLNNEDEELLYRTAVFHYLLGYIHPFYDGNGRLNRFISSYMISKELDPLLGYRLSYTIKANINSYYKAFKICNDKLNRGDLTPFIETFLDFVNESAALLVEALQKRIDRLSWYLQHIYILPNPDSQTFLGLYSLLVQAALFSESGISTADLLAELDISRGTLPKKLKVVDDMHLLICSKEKKQKVYSMDLNAFDSLIERVEAAKE